MPILPRLALIAALLLVTLVLGYGFGASATSGRSAVIVTQMQTATSTFTGLQQITVTSTATSMFQLSGGQTGLVEYCFSPGGNCAAVLVKWISTARTSIHVMIYSFTLDNVRDALIHAKGRGIDVRVVFDQGQVHGQESEYSTLKNAGVDVRIDTGAGLMHDKVAIVDNRIVITGSFNWSVAANTENNENLLVIDNSSWAAAYENQFLRIWNLAGITVSQTITTQTSTGTTRMVTNGTQVVICHPSYPTVCIPSPPPKLNCKYIRDRFGWHDFPVLPPDPHGFDHDNDGIGCEA